MKRLVIILELFMLMVSCQLKSQEFSTFYETIFKQREEQLGCFTNFKGADSAGNHAKKDSSLISFDPLMMESVFNTTRPFGYNNASFISAKGFQLRYSLGVGYHSKWLSFHIRPEYLTANNPPYRSSVYYGQSIQLKHRQFYPGQSSLKIHLWKFDLGVGTENMVWGPGQFNALILSNHAPGFQHFLISTGQPIRIGIGNIQFNLLGGKLENDRLLSSEVFFQRAPPPSDDWRFLSGINFTYQPVFIPNFYIGFNRTMQMYGSSYMKSDKPFLRKYVPVLAAVFAKKINTQIDAQNQNDGADQQASLFMRFVMPSNHIEFYTEYGYNDFKANLRDFFLDPQHAAAYIVGFKKIFGMKKKNYWTVNGEITQMSQSNDYLVRNAGNWYEHSVLIQGLTHKNQILGAGSGMGNNVQVLNINKNFNNNLMGFKMQRIQNDPRGFRLGDLSTLYLSEISWTDFAYGPVFRYNVKKLLFTGEIQAVHSKNYAWEKRNLFNLYSYFSIAYKFK